MLVDLRQNVVETLFLSVRQIVAVRELRPRFRFGRKRHFRLLFVAFSLSLRYIFDMNGDIAQQYRARAIMSGAINRGELIRQPCERCGNPKSHGHHSDYSKPLDVIWLCAAHHNAEHGRGKRTPQGALFTALADRIGISLAIKLEQRVGHDWNHEETS